MNSFIGQNTEAAFVLSSVMEFLHVWRSGEESALSLQCKEGKAVLNLQVSLGSPDKSHFRHDDPRHGQPRKKSERRRKKDNARAAAYRAAKANPAVPAGPPAPPADLPPVSTSPVRPDNSPALRPSHSTRPLPTFQAVTSQDPSPEIITKSGKRRKVWEPSDLDSTLAGQRETLPLSPADQRHPRHLFSPGEQREGPRSQDSFSESPHPAVTRESPDPHLSSPRQIPEDSEALPTELVHLPNGTDLQRMQKLELCSRVPPHSCREYWSTLTDEEDKQLDKWLDQCNEQTQGDPRPDIEADEEGYLPISFSCSMLRDLRYLSLRHNQLLHHGPVTALTSHCPTAKKDE